MKVIIVGGSAQSTPVLFESLSTEKLSSTFEVILSGRSIDKLSAVTRAAAMLSQEASIIVNYVTTESDESLCKALYGADVVILQIRVGGYKARIYDETFPLKYGLCGDEGLGVGGMSAAWRTWSVMEPLLAKINSAAPGALLIVLTSPVGILVRAATHVCDKMQVAGICELPWTTLNNICKSLNVNVSSANFEYFGVNHLGWFYDISLEDRDLIKEYEGVCRKEQNFPSGDIIEKYTAVPTKYLKLHFNQSEVFEGQKAGNGTRGEFLEELSTTSYSVFKQGSLGQIKTILKKRDAPWYPHAICPLLLALTGKEIPVTFFLSVNNNGYYPDFSDSDVLEIPHYVKNGSILRYNRVGNVPKSIAKLTSEFIVSDNLAAIALLENDTSILRKAVESHPWIKNLHEVPNILKDIINSNKLKFS